MTTYTTIIVDDEAIARQRMVKILATFAGVFNIIAEASNGIEGAELINELQPDLVFLDIQMPGKTGFEMLECLTHLPQIVFCTAYEEYALEAFNTMALDYLIKPIEKQRLELTIDKLAQNAAPQTQLQVQTLLDMVRQTTATKKLKSIPHKIGDRVLLIKVEDITYLSANDKYVAFYTRNGKEYLTEMSLKKLCERLPDNFKQSTAQHYSQPRLCEGIP